MFSALRRTGRPFSSALRQLHTRPHTHTPIHPKPTRTSPSSRYLLGGLASLGLYLTGAFYPPEELRLLYPTYSPPLPLSSPEHITTLESTLQTLPLLQTLRTAPDAAEWYETRPYARTPPERRVNHLTGGALRGAGRLAIPPLVRARRDEGEAVVFVHLGRGLCGHEGIVHGGLLATLLDECLGREAIVNLPEKVGVTATLNLNYRAPTKADQFVVIRTRVDEVKGRKVFVSGAVEDLEGKVLVEATAMFVQPKYAHLLNKKTIAEAVGEQTPVDGEDLL
nr:thioesterase/thiol ester dehydrase-isomerase [Flammulina filiformis]